MQSKQPLSPPRCSPTCSHTQVSGASDLTFPILTFECGGHQFLRLSTDSSKFCPAEEHMGVSWNRTVVGSFDVQSCTFSTPLKDEAKRMCVEGHDGNAHWAVPDFFDCAFREIYSIRKEVCARRVQEPFSPVNLRIRKCYPF